MSEKKIYEHPKCRTCGSELTMDLNNDYFCMKSIIREEKHDDHFPNPFTLVRKEDLNWLYTFGISRAWHDGNKHTKKKLDLIKERYKLDE